MILCKLQQSYYHLLVNEATLTSWTLFFSFCLQNLTLFHLSLSLIKNLAVSKTTNFECVFQIWPQVTLHAKNFSELDTFSYQWPPTHRRIIYKNLAGWGSKKKIFVLHAFLFMRWLLLYFLRIHKLKGGYKKRQIVWAKVIFLNKLWHRWQTHMAY